MKRRNCNLDLRLQPCSLYDDLSSTTIDSDTHHHHHLHFDHSYPIQGREQQEEQREGSSSSGSTEQDQQQQQLTIFYNGRISVCDVTEFQARAIIMLASREMEERMKTTATGPPVSLALPSQLHSSTSLSMKRSLQRFLQKRKNRVLATSPYQQ